MRNSLPRRSRTPLGQVHSAAQGGAPMNGRVLKLFGLVAILVLVFSVTSSAFADNPGAIWTTNGDCGDETQDVNHFDVGDNVFISGSGFDAGDYDWEIKGQPGGASGDPGSVVASGTVTVGEDGSFCIDAYTVAGDDWGEYSVKVGNKGDNYRVEAEEPPAVCEETTAVPGDWSEWTVNQEDESQLVRSRTVTYYDANDGTTVCDEATEYEYMDRPVCEWNSELWADDPECQPPAGEAAVASPVPFCGGGVNVPTLANATLFVDGLEITQTGSYALAPGHYTWEVVANEGFEFPEGAVTRGEFDVEDCPRPPRTPSTGGADFLVLPGITAFTLMALVGRRIYKRLKSR